MLETNSDSNTTPYSVHFTSPFETLSPPSNVSLLDLDKNKSQSINDTPGVKNPPTNGVKDSLSPILFMNRRPVSGSNSRSYKHRRVGSQAHPSKLDLSIKLADEPVLQKNDSHLASGDRFKYQRGDQINSSESPRRGNREETAHFGGESNFDNSMITNNSSKIFSSIIKELRKKNKSSSSKTRHHKVLDEEVKKMELLGSPTMAGLQSLALSPQEDEKSINPISKHLNKALFNSRPKIREELKIKTSNTSIAASRTITPTQPLRVRLQQPGSLSFIENDDSSYVPSPSLDILNEKKRPSSTVKARKSYKISKVSQSFECLSQQENHKPIKPLEETMLLKKVLNEQKPSTAKNMTSNLLEGGSLRNRKYSQNKPSLDTMYLNQPAEILPFSIAASAGNTNARKFSPLRNSDKMGDLRKQKELLLKKKEEARLRILEREKQYQSLLSCHIAPSFERVSEKLKSYQVEKF